jgi:hypothetical protein
MHDGYPQYKKSRDLSCKRLAGVKIDAMPVFFIDYKTVFQLVHLLGVIIALSGAAMSDTTFFDSVADSTITPEEMARIRRGHYTVIAGLSIIIISGVGIYLSDPNHYLHAPKFLAKMTIVLFLTLNGFFFHIRHIPWLTKTVGTDMRTFSDFPLRRIELCLSGALSSASWISAVTLGTLTFVPYSYTTIMTVYIVFIGIASVVAIVFRKWLI